MTLVVESHSPNSTDTSDDGGSIQDTKSFGLSGESEMEISVGGPICARIERERAADLNNDGAVDAADAALLFGAWGATVDEEAYSAIIDINLDGVVDAADSTIMLAEWD